LHLPLNGQLRRRVRRESRYQERQKGRRSRAVRAETPSCRGWRSWAFVVGIHQSICIMMVLVAPSFGIRYAVIRRRSPVCCRNHRLIPTYYERMLFAGTGAPRNRQVYGVKIYMMKLIHSTSPEERCTAEPDHRLVHRTHRGRLPIAVPSPHGLYRDAGCNACCSSLPHVCLFPQYQTMLLVE